MEKAALVLQGGGFRGAFSAGVLDILNENNIEFETVVGVSIGSLCLCNYLSGQPHRSIDLLRQSVNDQVFSSFNLRSLMTKNLFSYDYLLTYNDDKIPAFDYSRFYESKTNFIVTTSSLEKGGAKYINVKETQNPFDAVFASASLISISKGYKIDGETCFDGSTADPIPYRYTKNLGYDKVVVIETQDASYRKEPIDKKSERRYKRHFHKYPEFAKTLIDYNKVYNETIDLVTREEQNGHTFVLRPSINAYISLRNPSIEKLDLLYEDGRKCALDNLNKLKEYLSK